MCVPIEQRTSLNTRDCQTWDTKQTVSFSTLTNQEVSN
jgi:hypothetical protein